MKMRKIFVLAMALLINLCAFASEPIWQQLGKNFKVKGGVGIQQFVKSLDILSDDFLEPEMFDVKNGYFAFYEEGDGRMKYNASYWNRKDGTKLFIVSYDNCGYMPQATIKKISSRWGFYNVVSMEDDPDMKYFYDTGFRVYQYDETTKQLIPLDNPPFNGWVQKQTNHCFLELPCKGKDIRIRDVRGEEDIRYHLLKWNGMTFDYVDVANQYLDLYVMDKSGEATNIRNAPNGKVVATLAPDGIYNLCIDKIQNGWCHIHNDEVLEFDSDGPRELKGSNSGYWIHNSVIGASGLGAGGVTLYATPSDKSKVVFKSTDFTAIHPVEIKGEWVKVYVGTTKTQGWMKISEICSNPVTNCC